VKCLLISAIYWWKFANKIQNLLSMN